MEPRTGVVTLGPQQQDFRDIRQWCRIVATSRDPPGQQSVYINPGNQEEETYRRTTFARFPADCPVSTRALAEQGFVYTGYKDRVKCFNCGIQLDQWKPITEMQLNKFHYHQCEFYTGIQQRNKPMRRIFPRQSTSLPYNTNRPSTSGSTISRTPSAGDVLMMTQQPAAPNGHHLPMTQQLITSNNDPAENISSEQREHLFPCLNPINPHMRNFNNRLATYDAGWQRSLVRSSTTELAESGLYFLGTRDRLKCWYCNGGLQNWEFEDDPWLEHAKWFPTCEYLLKKKGPEYVHGIVRQFPNLRRPLIRNPSRSHVVSGLQSMNEPMRRSPSSTPETTVKIIDPKEEMKKLKKMVKKEMTTRHDLVSNAQAMGFERKVIRAAFERNLSVKKTSFSGLGDLVESIVNFQGDGENEIESSDEEMETGESKIASETPSVSTPQEEIRKLEEERLCKICRQEDVQVVFLPCGHLASCVKCSASATQCPLCKIAITERVRTYAS